MAERLTLMSADGAPIADNRNSLTVGPRWPVLMQDYQLLERIQAFKRERIPARVVHAKGAPPAAAVRPLPGIRRQGPGRGLAPDGRRRARFSRMSTIAKMTARAGAMPARTTQDVVAKLDPLFF